MDHAGEAARPTTVGSADLGLAGAVQGSQANIGSCAFDGQLGTATAALGSFSEFDRSGAHHSSTGFARQVRAVAGRDEVLDAAGFHFHRQPGPGVAYANIGKFWRQLGPLPDGVMPVLNNDGYSAQQPRPGAGPGHGEVLVSLLPGGAGRGEVPVGAEFDNSGNFAQQTLPGTGRADGIAGMIRDPNLGAGYDGSGALADELGAAYENRGMVAEHLRRLLPFAGIGTCSVAVNGLAAGPGSPPVAFHLFALLLGGLFLVLLHVLRV